MGNSMLEKANAFDKNGLIKTEVVKAVEQLQEFKLKFPFTENPQSINWLNPDDIFNEDTGEAGVFFRYLEYYLEPLGHIAPHGSVVYRNVRMQLDDFKGLLRVAVDKKKSLAEKVNARWKRLSLFGARQTDCQKNYFLL